MRTLSRELGLEEGALACNDPIRSYSISQSAAATFTVGMLAADLARATACLTQVRDRLTIRPEHVPVTSAEASVLHQTMVRRSRTCVRHASKMAEFCVNG